MGEEGLGRKMMNEGTQRSGAHLDEEEQLGASGGEGAVHVPLPVQLAGGLSRRAQRLLDLRALDLHTCTCKQAPRTSQ